MENIFNENISEENEKQELLEKIELVKKEILEYIKSTKLDFVETPREYKKILEKYFVNSEEIYNKCVIYGTNNENNYNYYKLDFSSLLE